MTWALLTLTDEPLETLNNIGITVFPNVGYAVKLLGYTVGAKNSLDLGTVK